MSNKLDFAIAIGVEHYKGTDSLGGPHEDVGDFIKWLTKKSGGDIPKENVGQFLSTSTYTPTQDDIDDWIDTVLNGLQQRGEKGRRFFFYFSGHGIGVTMLNSAMLLPKWTYSMRNYALSSERYLLELVNKGVFQEIFFFMDCCRNRIAGVQGQPPLWAAAAPSSASSEYLMYYASEFDNPAFEASLLSSDGKLDNLLPRGLFTKVLLDALDGAAADRTGKLCVQDLVNYVKRKLPELAKSEGKTQIPRARVEIDLQKGVAGPFQTTINVQIQFKTPGLNMVIEDPDLTIVHSGKSDGTWNLSLKRGEHTLRRVEDTDGQKIYIDGVQNKFTYA
jgi:hypothetical protein